MTTRLTPEQARDPEYVERVAVAEFCYEHIVAGRIEPPPEWLYLISDDARDDWRFRAERLLADLVETPVSDPSAPQPRHETITWRAVDGPKPCADCGHNHWAWVSDHLFARNWAPQWRWCDDPTCSCTSLRMYAEAAS